MATIIDGKALAKKIRELRSKVTEVLAQLEVSIDFSDEDVDWEKIPEVQARIRCAIPRRFECLDE